MKTIIFIFFALTNAYAGEFSEIDITVRETIVNTYTSIYEGEGITMDHQKDISALELEGPNLIDGCPLAVTGLANKPSYFGTRLYRFWVCVEKNEQGIYQGTFIDDEAI
jgi:hypothetical protein